MSSFASVKIRVEATQKRVTIEHVPLGGGNFAQLHRCRVNDTVLGRNI